MGLSINYRSCCVVDTPDMEYVSCSTALNLEMSLLKENNALTAQVCWSGDGIDGDRQPPRGSQGRAAASPALPRLLVPRHGRRGARLHCGAGLTTQLMSTAARPGGPPRLLLSSAQGDPQSLQQKGERLPAPLPSPPQAPANSSQCWISAARLHAV